MLPVAFEALSVRTPHPGKSANAKQDSGGSAPFTEMIDDHPAHATSAKGNGSESPRSAGQPLLAESSSLRKTPATAGTPPEQESTAFSLAPGEALDPAYQKGTKDTAGMTVSNAVSVNSTDPSPGKVNQDSSGNIGTELPADIAGLIGTTTKSDAQPKPAKQSGAHGAKAADDENIDSTTTSDQTGDGAEAATAVLSGSQPDTAAVAALVDPSAPTGEGGGQPEPQAVAATSTPTMPAVPGKIATASADIVSDQPETKAQRPSVGAAPTTPAADLALVNLGSDEGLELPPTLSAVAQMAAAQGKEAQAGTSAKLDAPLSSQPGANAGKSGAAVPSDSQGLVSQTQATPTAPAPHAVQSTEIDPQKASLPQHDSLSQDAPAAQNNSNLLAPSTTLSLNGITIGAPAGTPHDAGPVGAIATTSQSAPAALVPVSGIAVEIASKALAGKNRFEIRLDPPELGRIHVRLDVDSSGQISSHVVADRSDTLDLLRRDAPSLERALQDAGLRTSNSGLQFSLRDHGFARQEPPLPMPANARLIVSDEALAAETTPAAYRLIAGLRSGLDIRV